MNKPSNFRWLITAFLAIVIQFHSAAQPLRIAVAANAQGLIKKLQADFKKKTGIETEVIIGASGKLTAQIINGAPYDVFLSADTGFPNQLFAQGFGLSKPKVYALGSLIVCGNKATDLNHWQRVLAGNSVKKIAIANPKIAPYGKAAEEALKFYGLNDKVNGKIVYGESISQVNTYIQTAVVNVGFTTEAFLYEHSDKSKLRWERVDQKSYNDIAQAVILLTHSKKTKLTEATRFYDYLSSPAAKKIIGANGYHLPNKN